MAGSHTWEIVHDYTRCASCGFVFEDRQPYRYLFGKYVKDVECPRCHHSFEKEKVHTPKFGPLLGE
jgi:hypothetical protein